MASRQQTPIDPREDALIALLAATESLADAIAGGEAPEAWTACVERREAAFADLVRATAALPLAERALAAGARACLDRIASLDESLLSAGQSELARMQRERIDLGRRRQAVAAHGAHERNLARAVAVKA
ncbi:MAG: hypothetical protein IPK00_00705 [Deltaproteobacteria bacterium]|nr:hypothetical protein [Deltaproteobacteria bacterium]